MLLELVYIQRSKKLLEAYGVLQKLVEGNGKQWKGLKVMEPYGSLWKTQECSIGKLCNR